MKKRIINIAAAAAAAAVLTGALTACSGNDGSGSVLTVPSSEITKAVLSEIEMNSAVEKDINSYSDYYSIDASVLEDASVYICASGAYPDEIAVFRFKNVKDANDNIDALNDRLTNQKELFETYTPDEMYKLDNAKVYTYNNYAVFLACEDNDKAKELADGAMKEA